MLLSTGFVLAAALSAFTVEPGAIASFGYDQVRTGQKFEIVTRDRTFRGEFVDPASGECLLATTSDGSPSGSPHRAWLLGATRGSQAGSGGLTLMLMHQVRVGMKMELAEGDLATEHRSITAPVVSITLLPNGAVPAN